MRIKLLDFNKILFNVIIYSVPLNSIITNRLHSSINILILFFASTIFLLLNYKNLTVNKKYSELVLISIVLLSILIISNFMQTLFFTENLYYTMLLGFQFIFGILIFIFAKVNFSFYNFKNYLNYILIISLITLLYDTIVLSMGLDFSYQIVYRGSVSPDMVWRPHGLVGQASVNSAIIVFTYMLRQYIVDKYNCSSSKENIFYFLIMFFSIILQKSGIGFLALLFVFMPYFFKKYHRLLFLSIFSFILIYLFLSDFLMENVLHKLSIEYILANMVYFENLVKIYLTHLDLITLLFGGDSQFIFPIDLGPLYVLYHTGIIYMAIYTLFIIYLLYIEKNLYFRFAFIMMFLTSLHYPTIIYPFPAIIIFLLLYIIKNERLKYENYHNRS